MPGLRSNTGLDCLVHLRGGEDDSGEDEGVQVFRTVHGYDLEPMPTFSLRTPDQEDGVDYGEFFGLVSVCTAHVRTYVRMHESARFHPTRPCSPVCCVCRGTRNHVRYRQHAYARRSYYGPADLCGRWHAAQLRGNPEP